MAVPPAVLRCPVASGVGLSDRLAGKPCDSTEQNSESKPLREVTMPRHTMAAHNTSRTGSRRLHAHRVSRVSEFEQRAAAAWIRAADAGVVDSSELGWLLDTLHELPCTESAQRHR